MDTMKDGVELINAKPVPRPGRWVSAIIVAILAAMAIHGLVTNKNYQWNVVFQWLFSQSLMQGVAFTIILTVLAMVIGTVRGRRLGQYHDHAARPADRHHPQGHRRTVRRDLR